MLIQDFVEIPLPFETLVGLIEQSRDDLRVWAAAAYRRGERLAVGPGRALSTAVEMRVGEWLPGFESVTIPLEWEAMNATGLFPIMRAELVVAPLPDDRCQVLFRGNYEAPLDGLGRVLDRLALHRVAESTVRSFLERLALSIKAEASVLAPPESTK